MRRADGGGETAKLTIGGDDTCTERSTGFCNGPLEAATKYYITLRGYTEGDKYADSATSDPIGTGNKVHWFYLAF